MHDRSKASMRTGANNELISASAKGSKPSRPAYSGKVTLGTEPWIADVHSRDDTVRGGHHGRALAP